MRSTRTRCAAFVIADRIDASSKPRGSRHALGRARRALAPRPALRATVARRPAAAEHDRPYRAAPRGSSPRRDPGNGTTLYSVSDLYQRKTDNADTTLAEHFRLYAGDRQIGEIVRKGGTERTLFFHPDDLGSVDTIGDVTSRKQPEIAIGGRPLTPSGAPPWDTRAGIAQGRFDRYGDAR